MVCPCCLKCRGDCSSNEDCAPGCICSFGKCIRCEGCAAPSNCTLTVTITYSDATTTTLTYPDVGDPVELFSFSFGTCNVSAFYGDIDGEGNPAPGTASKVVELVCEECCGDGTGKNCSFGSVIENYYTPSDGKHITNFEFSLTCDPASDPCNEFP
jgi:hypothetical protein